MKLVNINDVIDVWCERVPKEDREDFLRVIRNLPSVHMEENLGEDSKQAAWAKGYLVGLNESPGNNLHSEDWHREKEQSYLIGYADGAAEARKLYKEFYEQGKFDALAEADKTKGE